MSNRRRIRVLPMLSCALVLAGLVAASRMIRDMYRIAGHIRDKNEHLVELEHLRVDRLISPEALRALESLSTHEAADLPAMAEKLLPKTPIEIQQQTPLAVGSGWILQQAHLTIENVLLRGFSTFIGSLESERPPWRVRECTIEANPGEPGSGRVSLRLEALHKEDIDQRKLLE